MKIYLTHSSNYDYQSELYKPLKQNLADIYDIFFPHDDENVNTKSKDIIATSDIVLAEVSYPSTGQGVELGWADAANKPVICFYTLGSKPSSSLRFICNTFIEYDSQQDMIDRLAMLLDTKLR